MRKIRVAALLLLAACARKDKGFEGVFTGSYQGDRVTLVLKAEKGTLTGAMQLGGVRAQVTGTYEGKTAKGKTRHPVMGVEVPFDATIDGDTIDWTYTYVVSGQKVPLRLTRSSEIEARGAIDPKIVGRWTSDDGLVVLMLNVDGTFERGAEKGDWRVEGSYLHTTAGASKASVRYVLTDGDLTTYDSDGRRHVWSRK